MISIYHEMRAYIHECIKDKLLTLNESPDESENRRLRIGQIHG